MEQKITYRTSIVDVTSQGEQSFYVSCDHEVRSIRVKVGFKLTSDFDTFFVIHSFSIFDNRALTTTGTQALNGAEVLYLKDLSGEGMPYSFVSPKQIDGEHTLSISSPTNPDATCEGRMVLSFEFRNF